MRACCCQFLHKINRYEVGSTSFNYEDFTQRQITSVSPLKYRAHITSLKGKPEHATGGSAEWRHLLVTSTKVGNWTMWLDGEVVSVGASAGAYKIDDDTQMLDAKMTGHRNQNPITKAMFDTLQIGGRLLTCDVADVKWYNDPLTIEAALEVFKAGAVKTMKPAGDLKTIAPLAFQAKQDFNQNELRTKYTKGSVRFDNHKQPGVQNEWDAATLAKMDIPVAHTIEVYFQLRAYRKKERTLLEFNTETVPGAAGKRFYSRIKITDKNGIKVAFANGYTIQQQSLTANHVLVVDQWHHLLVATTAQGDQTVYLDGVRAVHGSYMGEEDDAARTSTRVTGSLCPSCMANCGTACSCIRCRVPVSNEG